MLSPLWIVTFLVTASLLAQQAVIKAGTRLVTVDVNALDKNGRPVHGLGCADFTLEEARIAQTLQRCEEHRFEVSGAPAMRFGGNLPVNVFSNQVDAPLPETLDIVLVDFLNGEPDTRGALKQAARDLIRTVAPGHRMAVFAMGQTLTLLSGFTDDLRRLETTQAKMQPGNLNLGAVAQASDLAAGLYPSPFTSHVPASPASEALIGSLAASVMQDRADGTLAALRGINRYVAGLPGRKKLIWITSSFPNVFQPHEESGLSVGPGPSTDQFADFKDFQSQIEEVSRELAANRIAIYPVDVRGVVNPSMVDSSQDTTGISNRPAMFQNKMTVARTSERNERATMNTLADETGGHAFYGNNDVQAMVRKALELGSDFYTLTYRPLNETDDGRFRSFRIVTTRPETKLTYRRGYTAAKADRPATVSLPLSLPDKGTPTSYAMRRGLPNSTAILFFAGLHPAGPPRRGTAAAGNRGVLVEQEYGIDFSINPADLVWTTIGVERTADVILLLTAYDNSGGTLGTATDARPLKFSEAEYMEALGKGLHLRESILLPAGKEAFLRLGVIDQGSGREGTLEIPLSMVRPELPSPSRK